MDFVNVAIRIKPCQNTNGKSIELVSTDPPVIVVPERQISFSFDHIFPEHSTQENVYNEMLQPLVRNIINGYNSTIFAYGQTGTGKTYTIGSDHSDFNASDAGLITNALNDILSWNGEQIITTFISFVEIYNEKVYDLLGNNKSALQIKGFNVHGVKKQKVCTPLDAQLLLIEGGKNRHTGETKQNSKSSRSHAIFTIYCHVKHFGKETEAKLNLVDLAGSESVKKTGNEGSQLHEGININKGLLWIGKVINALSNNHAHVPYRESTITTILQDSLNKKNYVTLVACIGTNIEDLTETVQTLDFAQRAKRVRNKPEVNNIVDEYTKSSNPHIAVRNTPYKLTVSTPNKFTTYRTPLNSHSYNTHRKRPLSKFNSVSSLSTAEASLPSYSSMSILPEVPNTLSPIVKKCMEAVGETLLKRVTNIVTDIMTPMAGRVNSPRISRRSLEREVTKIVRNNILLASEFQTFRNEINSNRDTSACCIDDDDTTPEKNQAAYGYLAESFDAGDTGRASFIISGNKTPGFKKPFTPMKRVKRAKKSIAASSPIFKSPSPMKNRRRSVRISQRQSMAVAAQLGNSLNFALSPKVKLRKSTRARKIKIHFKPKISPKKPRKLNGTKRESIESSTAIDNHTKHVLKVLNSGNIKEIMTLNTIGEKYAGMICQFRQMRGRFTEISDLQEMPWRGKGYDTFLKANFLNLNTP